MEEMKTKIIKGNAKQLSDQEIKVAKDFEESSRTSEDEKAPYRPLSKETKKMLGLDKR